MKGDNIITIDGGRFLYEEALLIVRMLNSQNPITQMNATLMIWERNGTFRLIALGLIAIMLVVVFILVRR